MEGENKNEDLEAGSFLEDRGGNDDAAIDRRLVGGECRKEPT